MKKLGNCTTTSRGVTLYTSTYQVTLFLWHTDHGAALKIVDHACRTKTPQELLSAHGSVDLGALLYAYDFASFIKLSPVIMPSRFAVTILIAWRLFVTEVQMHDSFAWSGQTLRHWSCPAPWEHYQCSVFDAGIGHPCSARIRSGPIMTTLRSWILDRMTALVTSWMH